MDAQTTVTLYESPALVELGEFSEDALGDGEIIADFAGETDELLGDIL